MTETTLSTVNTATGEVLERSEMDRWQWAEAIRTRWQDSVGAILDIGDMLIRAKEVLKHGEFIDMVEADLPFGRTTAFMLIGIAQSAVLSNVQYVEHLPQSWGTLYELTRLPEPVLEELLTDGTITPETERQDVIRIRKALSAGNAEQENVPLPVGKFDLIYADPPWRYDYSLSDSRQIENQYPTMAIEDICALPVAGLGADNCVLFIWATSPKLTEAMAVIEAWGFLYRTCAVWVKDRIGMGYYFRQQHELLLVATKGSPAPPAPSDRVTSIINSPRLEHSAKPEGAYEIIERMYPKATRIELFARNARPQWAAWGNEIAGA